MNEELARVVEVSPERAKVVVKRGSACRHCAASSACLAFGDDTNIVEVSDPIGVRVGQQVKVGIESTALLKASAIVFLIPVLALMAGVFLGYLLAGKQGSQGSAELWAILGGISAFGIAFFIIRLLNDYFKKKKKFIPTITVIVGESSGIYGGYMPTEGGPTFDNS